ncbi:TPA: hypothetical protein EYP37_12875 [Candidatus Poribacteria bacterium]|nr:hypothetical protein [Candidatus Poribacteria bacterium]
MKGRTTLLILLFVLAAMLTAEAKLINIALFRFYAPINEGDISQFRAERLITMATGELKDVANFNVSIYFHPWVPVMPGQIYVESVYFTLKKLPGIGKLPLNGSILIGQGRNRNFGVMPSYSNRKTSEYTIVSDMFTHDRIQGVQLSFSKKPLFCGVSLHNGYKLGARKVGPVKFLADRGLDLVNRASDIDSGKEISVRAGIKCPEGPSDAAISFSYAKLYDDGKELNDPTKNDDITFLMDNVLGWRRVVEKEGKKVVEVDKEMEKFNKIRLGFDSTVVFKERDLPVYPSMLRSETYYGMTGDLNHIGLCGMLGVKVKPLKLDLYAVVGRIMLDLEDNQRSAQNSFTWNITQIMISGLFAIQKGITLRVEYQKNIEDVPQGGEAPANDKLFLETLMAF